MTKPDLEAITAIRPHRITALGVSMVPSFLNVFLDLSVCCHAQR
jgi:hypothetical protein